MKKNFTMDNVADFCLLQDAEEYKEEQFRPVHLKQGSFWYQTENGYRFMKWYAVIGDTVIMLPWGIWTLAGVTICGLAIDKYLGEKILDNVMFFLSHEFEIQGTEIVDDTITQWHVTFDLLEHFTEMNNEE